MKTRTKLTASIIAAVLCCVSVLTVFMVAGDTHDRISGVDAKVRTVELSKYSLDDQNLFDEFDEHTVEADENGFDIVAKKNFDASVFSEMDLVGINDGQETVTVRYEVTYIDIDDALLLTVTMEGAEDVPLVDTIPGLVSHNIYGEPDVMFVVDGERVWLSELNGSETLDEVGWFGSWLKKVVKNVVNAVAKAVVTVFKPVIRLGNNIAIALLGRTSSDIGAAILNMTPEIDSRGKSTGIYHANFDCWQQYFGYIDLYDTVFSAATEMDKMKCPFDVNNDGVDDHILWGWKGDYLNLGAGAELGIYSRWKYDDSIWTVDKNLAMKMTLRLDYKSKTIIDWQPEQKQWWITGFNSNYQNAKRDDLVATFQVTFKDEKMYKAFVYANQIKEYHWTKCGENTLSRIFVKSVDR